MTTELMAKAIKRVTSLPESLQDEMAREMIAEAEWEQSWERNTTAFESSIDSLATQALKEFDEGKTYQAGWTEL